MRRNLDTAKMLIRFYNDQAGTTVSTTNKDAQETVFTCLERIGGDYIYVKNHIRQWVDAHIEEGALETRFEECFEAIEVPRYAFKKPEENLGTSLDIIGKAVADLIVQTQAENIEKDIMSNVQEEVRNFISKEYGPIERKFIAVIDGEKHELKGTVHKQFEPLLKCVANKIPVFLSGPAGSGKNYLCKQVADALGLKFYFTNAVTQEYKLTGFTDANGNYQETQFYKAFKNGGLFMLDEMDASIPEVLVILNAAIANGYFDFPAPIGYVEAHPDFRVVAAGNTTGHGADYQYVGRNQLDGASLDRFIILRVDYSDDIENSLAEDLSLADFCREFRKAARKVGVSIIVSYRAISHLATMTKLVNLEDALEMCLVKDLEKDDLNVIINELSNSSYKSALKNLWETM